MRTYGPVQMLVASVPSPRFDGRVLAMIEQFTKSGAIRILDAMLLVMDEDGSIHGLDAEDLGPKDAAILGFRTSHTRGLFDSAEADEFTEGMVPGAVVVALAIESTWATALRQSLVDTGADMTFLKPVAPVDVHDAFDTTEPFA